ncbi:MAG: polysaccharide deacetylase family protein [Clostridium sp.]|nr:polysaccharide deacetylase family protein [Clostridium sp.]
MKNMKLDIVMYHYVRELRNSRYPAIKGMDIEEFEKQIKFFKNNFDVVTMQEVLSAVGGKGELPEKAMLLTFDDGYVDNYTNVYPILKNYGMQGSFFVSGEAITEHKLLDVNKIHFLLASMDKRLELVMNDLLAELEQYRKQGWSYPENEELLKKYAVASRFDTKEVIFIKRILQTAIPEQVRTEIASKLFERYVGVPEGVFAHELYMNTRQMRCMKADGMYFGIHGYNHYWLANLDIEKMRKDIGDSLIAMKEFIDIDNWVMNYPYGSFNENVIKYVKEHGCTIGLSTEVRSALIGTDNRYALPRWDCNDFPPRSENWKTLSEEI